MLKLFLVKRWYQPLLICFIVLVVTFVYRFPDVYAYITTPPGMVFLGQDSWFDPQDINTYASVIHYSQSGHFLIPNLWTAVPNRPIVIFPVEQLLGYIFRSVQPYFLFWMASIVCGVLLLIGMYCLIHKTITSVSLAALTTIAIALGGGFGIFFYSGIASSDITNSITFYETFFKPHEAISLLLYLYSAIMFYDVFIYTPIRKTKKIIIGMSFALTIAFLIYPYLIALYLLTTIPFAVFSKVKISIREFALFMVLPLLSVLFVGYQLTLNPGFYSPVMQHLSTDLLSTFLGYGILLPVFVFQLFFMKKTQFMKYLTWWILCALALSFLPFGPGKIFLRGLFFPLVLLDVLQLQILLKKLELVPLRYFYLGVFFVLVCMTNFYIMYLRMTIIQTPQVLDVIYMPKEDFAVFNYLNTHTTNGSGVLASGIMSNLIPAYTDDRTGIGSLWSFNSTYDTQLNTVNAFYAGQPVSSNYLKRNNISYVLWGPNEQQITTRYSRGNVTDLSQVYKNLKLVYQTSSTKLYRTK
jgi:hypothetical protein